LTPVPFNGSEQLCGAFHLLTLFEVERR